MFNLMMYFSKEMNVSRHHLLEINTLFPNWNEFRMNQIYLGEIKVLFLFILNVKTGSGV